MKVYVCLELESKPSLDNIQEALQSAIDYSSSETLERAEVIDMCYGTEEE